MKLLYGKFELPKKIKVDESSLSPTFARFIAEPFERGFGHTIGNALRRIMLTSLEAPAIISFRLEGVPHEFTAIEGVIEDMTHIILNLKAACLRYLTLEGQDTNMKGTNEIVSKVLEVTEDQIVKGNGAYKVCLKDVMGPSNYELVNPDLHLFTVTKPIAKKVDIRIGIGRGYVPAERHFGFEKMIDEIVIDTAFSPVILVNYFVENTRVGQDTDYDRLILEVETDGRIKSEEALTFAVQIASVHFAVFDSLKQYDLTFEKGQEESNKEKEEIMHKLSLKIDEIELSVRSTNCLSSANIGTIGELVLMSEPEMLKFRNFGKKSLLEIKQKLSEMGLSLGMDLTPYGITRENVKKLIEKHAEEATEESEV